ncbi:MAG: hypothetical protein D8H91_04495 [Alloprevotella sp.]|nr:MAG: hypothetical protein D8H91_04495 [Alloprevotella sp.]
MQLWGFFELYQIDVRRPNNNANSDRGKQRGLRSPHGRRGAICAHFGWTLDYLTNNIAWSVVQKMMLDAPSYDMSDGEEELSLTESNRDSIMDYVNSLM